MAETKEPASGSPEPDADALALVEEAEAEAAEAEALAAAARARARAARLRRQAKSKPIADEDDEAFEDAVDAEDAEDAEEEEAAPADGSSRRRLPRLSIIAQAAAIILILGFAGVSVYIVLKHDDASNRRQLAASYLAGAKQGVVNMTSLDFNKAAEDVQRVIDSSTGEFRDDFQRRAADFTKVVQQSKVVTEGTITAAAIETMGDHSAQVLIAATSKVTNSGGAKDEPRQWRLRVTVSDDGGQYKMSKVEFVP